MLSVVISFLATAILMFSNGASDVNTLLPFVILFLAITVVIYGGLFILKAIALCTMARRRKIKWWWVGMLPYANYVLLGKLAGPIRIFGMDIKNMGLVLAIVTAILDVANILVVLVPYVIIFAQLMQSTTAVDVAALLMSLTSGTFNNILSIVSYVLDIVFILSYFSLALAVFGKYAPQKRLMFTILSLIQPLFSIFLFIIRNNKAYSSADEYYRERMANRFGQTYNPYQNPYQTRENPFEDYASNDNKSDNNENPFDEY